MANSSILAAFERLWYHVRVAIAGKADVEHDHNTYATKEELENVLGGAAAKGVTNNTSTSSYLAANTNTVPTCATLYNFVQVSQETISTTVPSGSPYLNVTLDTPATKNEILVPVGTSSSDVFVTLHSSSGNQNYADSITFRRAEGLGTTQALSVTCYLMRLKVMKY